MFIFVENEKQTNQRDISDFPQHKMLLQAKLPNANVKKMQNIK